MSFSESIDLNVNTSGTAAPDMRDIGKAAKEAKDEVDKLDATDVDIAIDDAQLPAVKEALEEIRDQAEKIDQQEISPDVDTSGLDRLESSAGRATAGIDNVRGSGDKSRSVLANMVGNSAQDLGALGGIAGSTGVAIGQLAEYTAEGDIKLKNLVTTGGAMIGVGLILSAVMNDVAKEAKLAAEIDAFDAKRVEAYTEALRAGKTEIEAINERLRESEEIKAAYNEVEYSPALGKKLSEQLLPGLVRLTDAVPALAEANVTIDEFTRLVSSSSSELEAWAAKTEAAGVSHDTVRLILAAVKGEQDALAESAKKAAELEEVFGKKVDEATGKLKAHSTTVAGAVSEYDRLTAAAARFNPSAGFGGGSFVVNYHPPAPTPQQVQQAEQEYRRVQEGPS